MTDASQDSANRNSGRHDFDFLFGSWNIENRALRKRLEGCTEWEYFSASGTSRPLLGGLGNLDDFVPVGWRPGFLGMTLRLFNPATGLWSIYWASNQTGTLEPPVTGHFQDGIGMFEGEDVPNGLPIRVRFVWSEITQSSARWEQFFSDDGGTSWEKNWVMKFTRAEAANT